MDTCKEEVADGRGENKMDKMLHPSRRMYQDIRLTLSNRSVEEFPLDTNLAQ